MSSKLWPAASPDPHVVGRPYAGFTWELIQQLKQTFSEDEAYAIATRLVLGAAAANPSDVADAVRLSFIVDDNDGNLANGTPHFRALATMVARSSGRRLRRSTTSHSKPSLLRASAASRQKCVIRP